MEVTKNIYTIVKLTQFVDHIKKVPKEEGSNKFDNIKSQFPPSTNGIFGNTLCVKLNIFPNFSSSYFFSPTSPQSDQKSEKSASILVLFSDNFQNTSILESYM